MNPWYKSGRQTSNSTSNFVYSALKFSEIIQFYLVVFQKYSNSNYILYPSMEYLTTKILKPHPNWNMLLRSILRDSSRCSLHFIDRWKVELELDVHLQLPYHGWRVPYIYMKTIILVGTMAMVCMNWKSCQ